MTRKRIYIAGPFSGDVHRNVERATTYAAKLIEQGHDPFCPHLAYHIDQHCQQSYQRWMQYCLHWLTHCDELHRLTGESPGADTEVEAALERLIPVVFLGDDDE